MSEHTKGRLAVNYDWLVPEDHADRPIGSSTDKKYDREHYAHSVAFAHSKYHDQAANARRLAACWNAFENVRTDLVELITMQTAADAMEKLPAVQSELNAARSLLREVYEEGNLDIGDQVSKELDNRIHSYLDACDKPGAPDAS